MKSNFLKLFFLLVAIVTCNVSWAADPITVTYDFTLEANYPSDFPTKTGTELVTETEFELVGAGKFSLKTANNGSYYMITDDGKKALYFGKNNKNVSLPETCYLKFPGKTGYKITNVEIILSKGVSAGISTSVFDGNYTDLSTPIETSSEGDMTFEITGLAEGAPCYFTTTKTVSAGKNIRVAKAIITYTPQGTVNPTITSKDAVIRTVDNLDVSTLFTSNSSGAKTYSITSAPADATYTFNSPNFTASTTGTYVVKMEQAAVADEFNAGEKTANITVNEGYIATATAPVGGTYTMKVGSAEAVTVTSQQTFDVLPSTTVTMTSMAESDYNVGSTPFSVVDADGEDVSISKSGSNYSFTMPEKPVTITANFYYLYHISQGECTHGSITKISNSSGDVISRATQGTKVVVNAVADAGYVLDRLYYVRTDTGTEKDFTSNGYFTMVGSDITVYATFKENDESLVINFANKASNSAAGYTVSPSPEAYIYSSGNATANNIYYKGLQGQEYTINIPSGKKVTEVEFHLFADNNSDKIQKLTFNGGEAETVTLARRKENLVPTTVTKTGLSITDNFTFSIDYTNAFELLVTVVDDVVKPALTAVTVDGALSIEKSGETFTVTLPSSFTGDNAATTLSLNSAVVTTTVSDGEDTVLPTGGVYTLNVDKDYIVTVAGTDGADAHDYSVSFVRTYSVSYNLNGHGEAIDPVENITAIPSLPSPSATGYVFEGWYTDDALTIVAMAGATLSSSITLYAKWIQEGTGGEGIDYNYLQNKNILTVKPGNAEGLKKALEIANEWAETSATRYYVYLPDGTYDVGTEQLFIKHSNISLIGESMDNTIIVSRPPSGDNKNATVFISKTNGSSGQTITGIYLQDLTIRNTNSSRQAPAVKDKADLSTFKNVKLDGYIDTYFTDNVNGSHYLEDCYITGTSDFICGDGQTYFRHCTINERSSKDGASICAPNTAAKKTTGEDIRYGHVFENCTITSSKKYYLGRAWGNAPRCIWINTTLDLAKLMDGRWSAKGVEDTKTGIMNLPEEFLECNPSDGATTNAITFLGNDGTQDLEKPVANTIIADASLYSYANVLPANPAQYTAPLAAPQNVAVSNEFNNIAFNAVDGAFAYAYYRNGVLESVSHGNASNYDTWNRGDYTVRTVNNVMGGLGTGYSSSATVSRAKITYTLSMAGTLILPFEADIPDGLNAYIVNGLVEGSDSKVLCTKVTDGKLRANTPYLVDGTDQTYSFTGIPTHAHDAYQTGTLLGFHVVHHPFRDKTDYFYALQIQQEKINFRYILPESFKIRRIAKNRCYEVLPATGDSEDAAPSLALVIDDQSGTTDINIVERPSVAPQAVYTLQGIRVTTPRKGGIYIINGKKVIY